MERLSTISLNDFEQDLLKNYLKDGVAQNHTVALGASPLIQEDVEKLVEDKKFNPGIDFLIKL